MATIRTRNVQFTSQENQSLKGETKPRQEVKRTALKEVGNKLHAQNLEHGKSTAEVATKVAEKKQVTFPIVKFPIVKQAVSKQPSVQVKDTKACRLRAQHTRQIIGRDVETKTISIVSEEAAKKATTLNLDALTEITCGENIKPTHRPVGLEHAVETEQSKSIVTKTDGALRQDHLKTDFTKIDTNNVHTIPTAFSSTLLHCSYVIDIDKDDENDPIMLGMYAKDMYKYLMEMEAKFPISAQYLKYSKLTGKMRATLIDWLVEVEGDFEMNPETLFLTIAIIDRFLEKNPATSRNHLQLVGITAMLVASKYEEMIVPDISDLIYVSDNAYTKQEIIQMEITVVKSLDYSFGRPLPIHFLRRYSKAEWVAPITHVMAKYIAEMGVLEYDLCHIPPSLLAAAALYISLWLTKHKKNVWPEILVQYSSYSEKNILPVVRKLSMVLVNASTSRHQAIRKKYFQSKNLQVSAHPALKKLPELFGH